MYKDFFISNNNRFFGTATPNNEDEVKISIFKFISKELNEISAIVLPGSIAGDRFAVSDDGDLVASAVYRDYGKGRVVIYSIGQQKIINDFDAFNRVDWISFSADNTLLLGQKNKTYSIDINTGNFTQENYYRRIKNQYGEDIILKKEDVLFLNDKKFKSSTFSYFVPIGLKDGNLISENGGSIIKYDYSGEVVWKLNISEWGHAIKLYYSEEKNRIFADVFDYKNGDSTLLIIDNASGEIICHNSVDLQKYLIIPVNDGYVFDMDEHFYRILDDFSLELLV